MLSSACLVSRKPLLQTLLVLALHLASRSTLPMASASSCGIPDRILRDGEAASAVHLPASGSQPLQHVAEAFRFLLEREALTGYHAMKSMKLRGVVEADGTALRLYKRGGHNHFVALWGLVERPKSASMPRLLVYMVPVKKVSPNSVCPVECREDVLNTEGLKSILPCQRGGRKVESLLISDGAKLYGKLAAEHGMRHQFVVHSRGEWSRKHNSRAHGRLQINTGLIDQRWSNIKAFLPKSLTAGSKQGLADGEPLFKCDLWLYLYSYWLRSHFPDAHPHDCKGFGKGFYLSQLGWHIRWGGCLHFEEVRAHTQRQRRAGRKKLVRALAAIRGRSPVKCAKSF